MSTLRICDGCGKPFKTVPTIMGHRANGMQGGGLPDKDFDWCEGCAMVAFAAVRAAHATKSAPQGRAAYR